jgi:hypothetical protein
VGRDELDAALKRRKQSPITGAAGKVTAGTLDVMPDNASMLARFFEVHRTLTESRTDVSRGDKAGEMLSVCEKCGSWERI